MRIVSNAAAFPRDDRPWPLGAFAFSVVCAVAALAGSAALVATADSVAHAAGLLVVFVAMTGLEAVTFLSALRPWLEGMPVPTQTRLVQVGLVLLTLVAFAAGLAVGGAAACGFMTGVFAPSAWAIRHARINRGLERAAQTDTEIETEIVGEPAAAPPPVHLRSVDQPPDQPADQPSGEQSPADQPVDQPAADQAPPRVVTARRTPRVGPALREALADSTGRLLAWAAATVVTVVGVAALVDDPGAVVARVAFVGVCILVWVALHTVALWFAVTEFERSATVPKKRYVVLVKDPSPRGSRPMLGVWTTEPRPEDGRLPRAEGVYVCDSGRRALISTPGALVVHEAWVAVGSHALSTPRWVTADAGVALPTRRALLGWRVLGSVIETQRPARARALTMRAPHPNNERTSATTQVIMKEEGADGRWVRVLASRLTVMVAVAALFILLNR